MNSWIAAAADVASIGLFAAVGRASHAETGGLVGIAETGWPFAAGWAAGALITRYWRRAESLPIGAGVWAAALVGGMLLRALTGSGVQPPFVVVAATGLAILLLGWRGVYTLATRSRTQPA